MVSFRRCSQRTPPNRSLAFNFVQQQNAATTPCGAQGETGERLPPNSPLSLDLPRLKVDGWKAISLVLGRDRAGNTRDDLGCDSGYGR